MSLKQIYMGNNYIKPSKARKAIEGLKSLNIEVYIWFSIFYYFPKSLFMLDSDYK